MMDSELGMLGQGIQGARGIDEWISDSAVPGSSYWSSPVLLHFGPRQHTTNEIQPTESGESWASCEKANVDRLLRLWPSSQTRCCHVHSQRILTALKSSLKIEL
jgi:hypothetical protein